MRDGTRIRLCDRVLRSRPAELREASGEEHRSPKPLVQPFYSLTLRARPREPKRHSILVLRLVPLFPRRRPARPQRVPQRRRAWLVSPRTRLGNTSTRPQTPPLACSPPIRARMPSRSRTTRLRAPAILVCTSSTRTRLRPAGSISSRRPPYLALLHSCTANPECIPIHERR